MSTLLPSPVRALLFGALVSLSALRPAMASEEQDVYRCRVVGENAACERLPHQGKHAAQAPGDRDAYARYVAGGSTVDGGHDVAVQALSDREGYARYVHGGSTIDSDRGVDLTVHAANEGSLKRR